MQSVGLNSALSLVVFGRMDRYEKYAHWEVANAKPYRFWDSTFYYTPTKHGHFQNRNIINVPKYTKYEINTYSFFIFQDCVQYLKISFNHMC